MRADTGSAVDGVQRSSRLALSTPSNARQRNSGSIATSNATRPSSKSHGEQPASDDGGDADGRAARAPVGEPAEQQDRREHAHRREATGDLAIRPANAEDTREAVDEDRALVVEERREVEREARSVLVAAVLGDRVRVVGDRGLVAEEPRRVARRDPELERRDRDHDGEPDEQAAMCSQPVEARVVGHGPLARDSRYSSQRATSSQA